ncbi:tetratricopeptide repeat protein [Actinobacillus vicugnae]|uniref:tetratricopeptide repeat protein n=1 Tax=Actinobacillus vicugnae TaxID=2573093 RepID=UPI001242D387|nr:tetratricopeptide repeat protein [Actinobacillus vicugnae]
MKNIYLLIMLISNNVFSSELDKSCEEILINFKQANSVEKANIGLEYRNKYFSKSKQEESYCLIKSAMNDGYVEAEAIFSQFYNEGEFVDKDPIKGFDLTLKASNKGSLMALNNLGSYYFNGVSIPKDLEKAISYYKKAIDKGSNLGKLNLSYAYLVGEGVPKDINKAIQLAKEVVNDPSQVMAYEMALTNLGGYYGLLGLKKEELYWTEKAAKLDEPNAQVNLGVMYATDSEFLNKEKSLYWLN